MAVMKMGGATGPAINERKSRAEEALSATGAASEEGIVRGGGVALVRAGQVLIDLEKTLDSEQALGVRMVRNALSAPLVLISDNAGHEGTVILVGVRKGEGDCGFDADRGEFCNMIEEGIIDPVTITRPASAHAVSLDGPTLLT